mmetsp:Transcript_7282/g.9486  ORF Transcript_7282/g.9486 Transcript_7282/m.9486 type:complete len:517 (+) Transcript_7282:1-1551(+)
MKQRSHVLHELLEGFVSRKDVRALEKSLPPKSEYVVNVKMGKTQRRIITLFMREKRRNQMNILKLYQKLLVVWGHPAAVKLEDEEEDKQRKEKDEFEDQEYLIKLREIIAKEPELDAIETGTKVAVLLELIAKAMTLGDKTLVFSQSLRVISFIESVLQRQDWALNLETRPPKNYGFNKGFIKNRHYFRLDGSVTGRDRQELFNRFNKKSNAYVFLISTRAGNMGANLFGANRVVIFDSSFNPANDLQAMFRCYRYGQKKEVFVYRLLAERTMEEKIYTRQVTKAGLSLRVVDDTQVARTFTRDEVDYLTAGMDVEDPDYTPETDPNLPKADKMALLREAHERQQEHGQEGWPGVREGAGSSTDPVVLDAMPPPAAPTSSFLARSSSGILDQMHQRHKMINQAGQQEESVKDEVLRYILENCTEYVANFHAHEKLLEDKPQEQLSKEEMKNAWEDFNCMISTQKKPVAHDSSVPSSSYLQPSAMSQQTGSYSIPAHQLGNSNKDQQNSAHITSMRF